MTVPSGAQNTRRTSATGADTEMLSALATSAPAVETVRIWRAEPICTAFRSISTGMISSLRKRRGASLKMRSSR